MIGAVVLALRHALAHPVRSGLLAGCMAIAIAVPWTAHRALDAASQAWRARADATPIITGAAGSRFDLLFTALWFQDASPGTVPYRLAQELQTPDVLAIPLAGPMRIQGRPLVATTPEYHEFRGLELDRGTRPLLLGQAVLGARVARELELGVGDRVFSDPLDALDIAQPPSIELSIVGVLAPTGTPDDDAAFTTLETAWLIGGLLHAHDDAETLVETGTDVTGQVGQHVAVAPTLVEDQRLDAEDLSRVHVHGDLADAPLDAIILVPKDARTRTIVRTRLDVDPARQAIDPGAVVDELLAIAARFKRLVDGFAVVLAGSIAVLVGLVTMLSVRHRRAEFDTLHRVGAPRRLAAAMVGLELTALAAIAFALASGLVRAGTWLATSLLTA